jgi:c-di-GMP-binding flagellar brake protein YcgR
MQGGESMEAKTTEKIQNASLGHWPGISPQCKADERRRWPRFQEEKLVAYTWFDSDATPRSMGMAKTLDISEGGVSILLHQSPKAGDTLHLFMAVEDSLVQAVVRIVHAREQKGGFWRVGGYFTSLEERGRRNLIPRV